MVPQSRPAPLAAWPWPAANLESLAKGESHWTARQPDGTDLDFFRFDFGSNPRLRFELLDQDLAGSTPGRDSADYWPRSAGWYALSQPDILFASNGPFFSAEQQGLTRIGRHIAPVVVRGRAFYNVGNHRWAFGVKQSVRGQVFVTRHLPDTKALAASFTFAACGLQCLVREGRPLRVEPFPTAASPPKRGPVPSTPEDAGHIPVVDHMKTSRVSFGWTRDSRTLYALCVTEPDNETESALKLRHGQPDNGGWTLADLQRFWLSLRIWGAVNSDGGDVEQFAYRDPGGDRLFQPARWAAGPARIKLLSTKVVPAGGSLMYWVVRLPR